MLARQLGCFKLNLPVATPANKLQATGGEAAAATLSVRM